MKSINKTLKYILMYGTELVIIILSVFPILWVVLSSFKTNAEILEGPFTLPSGIETAKEVYSYLFEKYDFFAYFVNSFTVSFFSTVVSLIFFAMAAYVLAKFSFPGRNLLFALFTITMLVPGHAKAGPIFSLINSLNLYDKKIGLGLVYVGSGIAMSIFVLKSAFMAVPKELDEAAKIDGAGFMRTFVSVNLPLAKAGLSTAGILMFLGNWNEFFYAALLTASEKVRTLPVALQFFNQSLTYDYPKMFAALALVVLPAIAVYSVAKEQIQESLASTGIKG